MNFESSLLPVLGGYWLVTHLIPTRTDALRRSGYHTAFQSAFWGLVLLAVAYPVAYLLGHLYPHLFPVGFLSSAFDRAAVLSVMFGVTAPMLLNRFFDQREVERKIVDEQGSLIELLIAESIGRGKLVEVSLRNGKSYIGFALQSRVTRHPDSHVSIFPVSSGYRDNDTQELRVTTQYAPVVWRHIQDMQDSEAAEFDPINDLRVVIPRSEIVSARLFDPDLHDRFQEAANPPRAVESAPTRSG